MGFEVLGWYGASWGLYLPQPVATCTCPRTMTLSIPSLRIEDLLHKGHELSMELYKPPLRLPFLKYPRLEKSLKYMQGHILVKRGLLPNKVRPNQLSPPIWQQLGGSQYVRSQHRVKK